MEQTTMDDSLKPTICTPPCDEVQALGDELKRLMTRYKSALNEEGVRHEVKTLESWMDSYCRGIAAASQLSEIGPTVLIDLRDRLKLAADERLRLESEGGNPPTKQQAQETEELLSAIRRLEKLIPNVEQLFVHSQS